MISYTVARRTNEIGIRLALGARRASILGMIFKQGLWLVFGGLAIGVPVTLGAMRYISARLYGVSAADPLTIAGPVLLMAGVAASASIIPALRLANVDPMVALRATLFCYIACLGNGKQAGTPRARGPEAAVVDRGPCAGTRQDSPRGCRPLLQMLG